VRQSVCKHTFVYTRLALVSYIYTLQIHITDSQNTDSADSQIILIHRIKIHRLHRIMQIHRIQIHRIQILQIHRIQIL
jgi:hypothetical protein